MPRRKRTEPKIKTVNFRYYDLTKGTRIVSWDNKLPIDDPNWLQETLCLSQIAKFYLHVKANLSICEEECQGRINAYEKIIPLTQREAVKWAHTKLDFEVL